MSPISGVVQQHTRLSVVSSIFPTHTHTYEPLRVTLFITLKPVFYANRLKETRKVFSIHSLALEDITDINQRPQRESFKKRLTIDHLGGLIL